VSRPPLAAVALGCFAVGAFLMFVFEDPVTRVLGIGLLFAFIVAGVFAIATPARLEGDDEP
jgi:hypothetical protein